MGKRMWLNLITMEKVVIVIWTNEIEKAVNDYIGFYNNVRLQSKLKSQTPMEYRNLAI